jgi:DNA processing protein
VEGIPLTTSPSPGPYPGPLAVTDGEERLARAGLTALTRFGDTAVRDLVEQHGATAVYQQLIAEQADFSPGLFAQVHRALTAARRGELRLVIPGDPDWPAHLDTPKVADLWQAPPLALWVRGTASLAAALQHSVALAGARAGTSYGAHVATEIAGGCVQARWTVVAGGNFGCEAAAHRAALAHDGITVAVLGCGVDRPLPAGHNALFDRITEHGLLVSPYPPGTGVTHERHEARNVLVAVLAGGSVLVEAGDGSSAAITMKTALLVGTPAMVVPGPVTSAMSAECHRLLRLPGYRLVTSAADVLDQLTPF